MPQNAQGIHVSAEEERYLRTAFRRFALPYVIAFAVLAWVASMFAGSDSGGASTETVSALEEEVAGLRETVASLEERLGAVGAALEKAGGRVAALERRKVPAATAADSGLERNLRDANAKIETLERKIAEQAAGERLDALAARMTKLEGAQRAPVPAAPAPGPPPASGGAPAGPVAP
jgi:polyhydroxyalkanoate synthesis regulator phasin